MKSHAKSIFAALVWMMAQFVAHADSMLEVNATQRYPWNGLVYLECHVSNPYGANIQSFTVTDEINGLVILNPTLLNPAGNSVEEGYFLPAGDSFIVWNAAADLPKGWRSDHLFVTGRIKNRQSISFGAIGTKTFIDQVTLSATASSGGNVTFSVASGPGKISGGTLSFTGAGRVSVVATQVGNDDWCPATATQTVTVNHPRYLVMDLSGGSNASSYPVTYLNSAPSGGFNTDEYKKTKLAMRLIDPGTFMMGIQEERPYPYDSYQKCELKYEVTLTKQYYIGVFEVTQPQYSSVMGNNPSYWRLTSSFEKGQRPVEQVSYNVIRGSSAGAKWPGSNAVDANSFMGRLRTRTGLAFDLPTEAQWEYACHAGTTNSYNNNGGMRVDLDKLGCWVYGSSSTSSKQHQSVGSYRANNWGLYDMHGNVAEWCLDWYGSLTSGVTDPKGPSSGSSRVRRGGSWGSEAYQCTSYARDSLGPASTNSFTGFRLALPLSE